MPRKPSSKASDKMLSAQSVSGITCCTCYVKGTRPKNAGPYGNKASITLSSWSLQNNQLSTTITNPHTSLQDLEQLLLTHNTDKGVAQRHCPHPGPHAAAWSVWPLQPNKQLVSMDPRLSQPQGPQPWLLWTLLMGTSIFAQSQDNGPQELLILNQGAALTQHAKDTVRLPTSVFQVAERLQERICALCPEDLKCNVLYFAQSENIAAHENCLLYSLAVVESEDHDPYNNDRNFDVESVKKEIKTGRKLKCMLCEKAGATVGCDLKSYFKNYHFFYAKNDHTILADGLKGIYKVFCQQHADPQNDLPSVKPLSDVFHSHYSERTKPRQAYFSGVKTKRKEITSLNRQSCTAT
ncbi:hypothetical protein M91_20979 [Bos mutus]|uniref:PHD-type domain-containing protein n=1 Tax=Bos mutus TaxID=72004 RepID=L8HTT8_9CETA|nr:hypothetical protein M91_20979 [Bos mutus]